MCTWLLTILGSTGGKPARATARVSAERRSSFDPSFKLFNKESSIINERLINKKADLAYDVLSSSAVGIDFNNCRGSISDYLLNRSNSIVTGTCSPDKYWDKNSNPIEKPTLKFTVIHSLISRDNTSQNIPYLEYQFLIRSPKNNITTDTFQTITGEALVGGQKTVLQSKIAQDIGILDYVVQQ